MGVVGRAFEPIFSRVPQVGPKETVERNLEVRE